MIKTLAIIVIALALLSWSTGYDVRDLKHDISHWANGNARAMTGESESSTSDWGPS